MIKTNHISYKLLACLLLIFGFIFSIGIGKIHLFDLDELYFAEITREMMATADYSRVRFYFEPLYEKPPLFFWIQAMSMHLWGVNEIGARFPNVVCGLLTLITLYYIGNRYHGKLFGLLWMCWYGTTFLSHFYFKSGIIDPFFNYFMLLSIYFLSRIITTSGSVRTVSCVSSLPTILAGGCMGLALLTKGPLGVIIPLATTILTQLWICGRIVTWQLLLTTIGIAMTIFSFWLVPEIVHHGFTFIHAYGKHHWMLYHQPVDRHHLPWYYHFLTLFLGCFPSSLFAIIPLTKTEQGHFFKTAMQWLLVVVLLIFTLVGTKIVHYSSMAYFAITFLSAHALCQLIKNKTKCNPLIIKGFIIIGTILGTIIAALPLMVHYKSILIKLIPIKNPYIIDALHTPISWSYWDSIPAMLYIAGTIIAFYLLLKQHFLTFSKVCIITNALFLTLSLIRIMPKIEGYTQRALIDFCKSYRDQDVYLVTVDFKAAAPLFYTHKTPENALKEQNLIWLLTGPIDKPCFFITYKADSKKLVEQGKDIIVLKAEGCFAFAVRYPAPLCNPLLSSAHGDLPGSTNC